MTYSQLQNEAKVRHVFMNFTWCIYNTYSGRNLLVHENEGSVDEKCGRQIWQNWHWSRQQHTGHPSAYSQHHYIICMSNYTHYSM